MYYYRARYYDPEAEIFISQDPLGDAQRYVGGNPLSFTDPLGLYKLGTDGSLIPENNQERQTLWESGGVVDVTPEAVLDVVLTLYGGCKGAVSEIKPLIGFSQAGFKNALKQKSTGFVRQQGFSSATRAKILKQLEQNGVRSLQKSKRSLQILISEHQLKINKAIASGGKTSSMEREIQAFQLEINAIDDVLRGL
jgi:uncharacterized protein RhaS with RHS repeats